MAYHLSALAKEARCAAPSRIGLQAQIQTSRVKEDRHIHGQPHGAGWQLTQGLFDGGEDEPQRLEHFGNTPLEAMSAGCVPVVFDGGGLRETVRDGENGFRWRTVAELQQRTRELVGDAGVLKQMRACGEKVDAKFGVEPFLRAVQRVGGEMVG